MAQDARQFTAQKLHKMEQSGAVIPHEPDKSAEENADDYGKSDAKGSDSSEFRRGGAVHEHGKKPHMGRPHRAAGGRIVKVQHGFDPAQHADHLAEYPKIRARGGRAADDHYDEAEDRSLIHKMVKKEALSGDKHGGRVHRAKGGRTKGKTTVNVIIGAGEHPPPPPTPVPVPAQGPPPAPPPRPPGPPMGGIPGAGAPMGMPAGGMPIAAAPMGAMGAPRPPLNAGLPPSLRARGGRAMMHSSAAGGLGRIEKANLSGGHLKKEAPERAP